MKNILLIFSLLFLLITIGYSQTSLRVQGESENIDLVHHWQTANRCFAVDVVGNIAYFGDDDTLRIVDFSEPSSPPAIIGNIPLPNNVRDVAISGDFAYVAIGAAGLAVFDVTKPEIVHIEKLEGTTLGVAVSGDYAYVAHGGEGLTIIDISTPNSLITKGNFNTDGAASSVAIKGNYAYVADGQSGLQVIDISDPDEPTFVNSFDTEVSAHDIAINGNYAYVADETDGLRIIDISNLAQPLTEAGFYDTDGSAFGIAIHNHYAFIADGDQGLRIIDVLDPANTNEVGYYDTEDESFSVTLSENYIYVADRNEGLYVLTYLGQPPAAPTLVTPAMDSLITETTPTLTWNVPEDQDSNELHFKVEITTDENFINYIEGSPFESQINNTGFEPLPPLAQGSGTCNFTPTESLSDGEYWWRVSAWDGQQYSEYSESRRFTIDINPPFTSGHVPAKDEQDVHVNTNIIVHILDATSGVDQSSIIMKINEVEVTPEIDDTPGNYEIMYKPVENFGYNETITVSIDAADNAGNDMATDSYSFSTESQLFTVTDVTPESGAINISPDTTILVKFSNEVETTTINPSTFIVTTYNGEPIGGEIVVNGTEVTFDPTLNFNWGDTIRVRLTADIKDLDNNPLQPYSWWFKIRPPFQVVDIYPDSNTTVVSPDSIWVKFNRRVNIETIDESTFLVSDHENAAIPGNFYPPNDSSVVLFYPTQNLIPGEIIHVELKPEIHAVNSDPLKHIAWSFTINQPPTAPGLLSPANNSFSNEISHQFSWEVPSDLNDDSLQFKVEIAINENFSTQISGSPFTSLDKPRMFTPTPPLQQGEDSCNFSLNLPLKDGEYWWRVSAWDGKQYGEFSEFWKFTIDTTKPHIDEITLINFDYGINWYNQNKTTSGIVRVQYDEVNASLAALNAGGLSDPNDNLNIESGDNKSTLFEINISGAIDGGYVLNATILDKANNFSSDTAYINLDSTPPTNTTASSPNTSASASFSVSWEGGTDGAGSGLSGKYDVMVKADDQDWAVWKEDFEGTTAIFEGEHGHTYFFEAAAWDNVANREDFTGVAETSTSVDTTVFTVVDKTPKSGETQVSPESVIRIKFSNAVKRNTVQKNITLKVTNQESFFINGAIEFSEDDSVVTYSPIENLNWGDTIYVELTDGIQDVKNIHLRPESWWFQIKQFPGELNVTNFYPENATTNIPPDTPIWVQFNRAIDTTTVNDSTFIVSNQDGKKIYGNFNFNLQKTEVTFDPEENFKFGETIYIELTNGIEDDDRIPLQPKSWWFTIELPEQFFVTETYPDAEQTGVPADTTIWVKFNHEVITSTVNTATFIVTNQNGESIHGEFSFNPQNTELTFNPDKNFNSGDTITVTLTEEINDVEGIALQPEEWWFTIEIPQPFTVIDYRPKNAETNVSQDASIWVEFNRAVDTSTVTEAAFKVFNQNSEFFTGSFSYNTPFTEMTFNSAKDFNWGDTIYVELTENITDLKGNLLTPESWWFRIELEAFQVVKFEPENEALEVPPDSPISVEFNHQVDTTSVKASTFIVTNKNGDINGTLDFQGNIIDFVPTQNFEWGDSIHVQLTAGILDEAGTSLIPFQWWFLVEEYVQEEGLALIEHIINYPNPFKPGAATTIKYKISASAKVSINLYNVAGEILAELLRDEKKPYSQQGHEIVWDGRNSNDQTRANGIYICEIVAVSLDDGKEDRKYRKIAIYGGNFSQ